MNLRSLHMKNFKETFYYRWDGYEKNEYFSHGTFKGTEAGAKRVSRQIAKANGGKMLELLNDKLQVIFRLDDPMKGKWITVKYEQLPPLKDE